MDMEKRNTFSEISVPDETANVSEINTLNENQAGAKDRKIQTADETQMKASLTETIKDSKDNMEGKEKSGYDAVVSNSKGRFESYGLESGKRDRPSSYSGKDSGEREDWKVADTDTAVNDNRIETSINSSMDAEMKLEDARKQMHLSKRANVFGTDNVLTSEQNEVLRLTKENLQRHTKQMQERVKTTLSIMKDEDKANANNANSGPDVHINDKNENNVVCRAQNKSNQTDNASKVDRPKQLEDSMQNDRQNDKVIRSPGKKSLQEHRILPYKEIEKMVNRDLLRTHEHGKRKVCVDKSPKLNTRHKEKKKHKINVDDVETLVSMDKLSDRENRKSGKNKTKERNHWNESTSQKSNCFKEYLGANKATCSKAIECKGDVTDATAKRRGAEGGTRPNVGHAYKHQRLVRLSVQPRYMRRPVYDSQNTSTQLILLNNKCGKHSRLWKAQETQPDRTCLIDPSRHLREPSFYLSGHFHSRCSTSEIPTRYMFPPSHLKFDFSGRRPSSEKIGNHLYEARYSKNPQRHRTCTSTPAGWLKPLDFSAPNKKTTLPVYVFEWERLYAEPPLRPSRPSTAWSHSTVTVRKIRNQKIIIQQPTYEPDTIKLHA